MSDSLVGVENGALASTLDAILSPTVSFPCGSCGGHGAWHAARQDVVCASCATALTLPPAPGGGVDRFDLVPLLRDRADSGRTWQPAPTSVRCVACHAITRLRAGVAAATCGTCGAASLVVIDQSGAPISPTGVVPFHLSEPDARDAVRAWLASHARLDFGRARFASIDLRAVYLPWWDFFAHVHCPWRMERTRTSTDGEQEKIVTAGAVDLDMEETLPAVASVPDALLAAAGPFDAASARPFDVRYLAGTTVEHYTVNLWDGWDAAYARMRARLDKALRADARTWVTLPDEQWPSWTRESARMLLVPLFVGTYTSRGGRTSPVVVNGATGKVAADWAWSLGTRILGAAVLAAMVAGATVIIRGAWALLRAVGFQPLW